MSAPLCHRLMVGSVNDPSSPKALVGEMYWCRCIGSRCALWVPERGLSSVAHGSVVGPGDFSEPRLATEGNTTATGKGWCAENLRRAPWDDPAKEAE